MFVDSSFSVSKTATKSDNFKADLIINHIDLGMKLAWKLLNSWQARLSQDDVKSIVGIALCEAANNFDGRPGVQFQTFLYYHLRGRLLREITENVKSRNILSKISSIDNLDIEILDPIQDVSRERYLSAEIKTAEQMLIQSEDQNVLAQSFTTLDSLEQQVISRHYLEEESLVDLAVELGYCRCHLSRVKRRALSKLKRSISGYFKEYSKVDSINQAGSMKVETYTGGRGRRRKAKASKLAASTKGRRAERIAA